MRGLRDRAEEMATELDIEWADAPPMLRVALAHAAQNETILEQMQQNGDLLVDIEQHARRIKG